MFLFILCSCRATAGFIYYAKVIMLHKKSNTALHSYGIAYTIYLLKEMTIHLLCLGLNIGGNDLVTLAVNIDNLNRRVIL